MADVRTCGLCRHLVVCHKKRNDYVPACDDGQVCVGAVGCKCNHFYETFNGFDPGLQLLIIDLGDSCVMRLDKGQIKSLCVSRPDTGPPLTFENWTQGTMDVVRASFDELRAAIDKLSDGEKPLPRIERDDEHYVLVRMSRPNGDRQVEERINRFDYDTLSQLAGKPLPVYEGKKGEWRRLHPTPHMINGGKPFYVDAIEGVEIWRYTR